MSSDDSATGLLPSPMRQAWSSSSISTIASQVADPEKPATIKFDLSIEEKGSARAQQAKILACSPQLPPAPAQPRRGLPMLPNYHDYHHSFVPKSLDLAAEYSKRKGSQAVTTLMIRNIPNVYSQRDLVAELEALGFCQESFDFLYLPVDNGTKSNVGYAFVNFVSEGFAKQC